MVLIIAFCFRRTRADVQITLSWSHKHRYRICPNDKPPWYLCVFAPWDLPWTWLAGIDLYLPLYFLRWLVLSVSVLVLVGWRENGSPSSFFQQRHSAQSSDGSWQHFLSPHPPLRRVSSYLSGATRQRSTRWSLKMATFWVSTGSPMVWRASRWKVSKELAARPHGGLRACPPDCCWSSILPISKIAFKKSLPIVLGYGRHVP